MKLLKLYLLLMLSLLSLHSFALIITDSHYDFKLYEGQREFSTNMLARGYDPTTDTVNSLDLLLVFREINDDGATEHWEDGNTEFVIFYTMLFGPRMRVNADIDTGSYSFSRSWAEGESTCLFWDETGEVCEWNPVASGIFGIGVDVYTDNLWVTEATWKLDVTRANLAEPSAIGLFVLGLLLLAVLRCKQLILK